MAILGILLLVGGAMAGLVGLGGLGLPDLDPDAAAEKSPGPGATFDARDDLLVGGDGADLLDGGAGGDWIIGLDGHDTLTGGTGGDVIIPGAGQDQIAAGDGNDFVEAANVVDEDALRQSSATADDIFGVDFAYALPAPSDAADTLDLGPGDDTVVAGARDILTGGTGADEFALGDWIGAGGPAEITDFNAAEDIITFVYDRDGDVPELSIEHDEATGVTTILADGRSIAVLRDSSPAFSLRNVAVGRYAA
ncbi:MAG: calcium-binding protein [Roseovarius sp.]